VFGGKGVGSQGDGSAQFIVRDEDHQNRLMEVVKRDFGMDALPLVIEGARRIRKSVIPAAGFGTRLFPASKAIKKEMFPVVDRRGRIKPAILAIVEEAIDSGIGQIGIIVQERDRHLFEDLFHDLPIPENYNRLSEEDKAYCQYLLEVGERVTFLTQDQQAGFGHAVHCSREWVGDEPFLVLLGDHLHASDTEVTCTGQLLNAYETYGTNFVGLKVVPESDVGLFGCVSGVWVEEGSILEINQMTEKPDPSHAREHLAIDGVPEGHYLAFSGQYILSPQVFELLRHRIESAGEGEGEIGLTGCLDELRRHDRFFGYVVKGRSYDIGTPDQYRKTLTAFRSSTRR
jgi:UTP-glucose-1-phosphate uridylyltransferase